MNKIRMEDLPNLDQGPLYWHQHQHAKEGSTQDQSQSGSYVVQHKHQRTATMNPMFRGDRIWLKSAPVPHLSLCQCIRH
jgi:hypothetical protein